MITQKELKEVLSYNPLTGLFVWKISPSNSVPIGSAAGYVLSIGYIFIGINYERYLAHRLAFIYMENSHPEEVDHQNHIRSDNRWKNLIAATRQTNKQNQPKLVTNTSGFTGVTWNNATEKWRAQITINKKNIYLGTFIEMDNAISARKEANIKFGFHENHGKDRITVN